MKSLLALIFLITVSINVHAQNAVIAAENNNSIYAGIDIPLSIAIENVKSEGLLVTTDLGTITLENGKYVFRSSEIGTANIKIYKQVNGVMQEIASKVFKVKYLPNPYTKFGPLTGGRGRASYFKDITELKADYDQFDYDVKFNIDSFRVVIEKADNSVKKSLLNTGNHFNLDLLNAVRSLQPNDKLTFGNVYVTGPDNRKRVLAGMELRFF